MAYAFLMFATGAVFGFRRLRAGARVAGARVAVTLLVLAAVFLAAAFPLVLLVAFLILVAFLLVAFAFVAVALERVEAAFFEVFRAADLPAAARRCLAIYSPWRRGPETD